MERYIEIANSIEDDIANEMNMKKSKLASIRVLADEYQCSKGTIVHALEYLKSKHIVYSIPKSGYFIVNHQRDEAINLSQMIDFSTGAPNWKHFPYYDFQHCLHQSIDRYQRELFQYGTLKGLPSLVNESKKLLETYHVYTKEEQIVVVSGMQQALSILCQMNFPNHKSTILIEEPGYHLFIQTLKMLHMNVCTIPQSSDGIDFKELETIFKNEDIKFFYTMPRIHNPLGTSYTNTEKKTLCELANTYDVYIVEDDYLADFETNTKVDPIHYYDVNQKVVYLKSFSKIMFPGLRIGLSVLPSNLVNEFVSFKQLIDIDSSVLSQGALDIYIKSGMFERHTDTIRNIYNEKAKLLTQIFTDRGFIDLLPTHQVQGARTYITLPNTVDKSKLISSLMEKGVYIEDLKKCYYNGYLDERRLRLDFANIDIEDLNLGLTTLCDTIQSLSQSDI